MFKRKLPENMKMYDYAKVIDTTLSREHFMQHGLHMNRLRKEPISKTISGDSILTRQQPPPTPISLKWKEDPMVISPVQKMIDKKSANEAEPKGTKAPISGRCRKHPVTLKDNFFTVNGPIEVNVIIIDDRKAHCPQ
jgi:hypothetical protein